MKKIFILGSLNMDLVITSPKLPEAGETIKGSGFMTNPGGKGANQAVACGKLKTPAFMIGAVGDDANGTYLVENLKKFGVNADYISIEKTSTGVAVILLSEGDNRIILDAGANALVEKNAIASCLHEQAQQGDIFVSQLEIPLESVAFGLRLAKQMGLMTILNAAPATELSADILSNTDLLIVNETEAFELSKIAPVHHEQMLEIDRCFKNKGVKNTIITLGEKGSVFCDNDQVILVPAFKVKAEDTTAAGDAYVGSIAVELSRGKKLVQAMKYATAVSALTVMKKGAQQSIPDKKAVDDFIKQVKSC